MVDIVRGACALAHAQALHNTLGLNRPVLTHVRAKWHFNGWPGVNRPETPPNQFLVFACVLAACAD